MTAVHETAELEGIAPVSQRLPIVAIVGRPNAGKSTLFNRLVRSQRAIVDRQPGVTRDRNVARATWDERPFLLVDTGGFEDQDESGLAVSVRAQSAQAAQEADVVIALLDGREGCNPADREFVQRLRRLCKPVLYAVNKLDTPQHDDDAADFFTLGVDDVVPISAAHGRGIDDLMTRVFGALAVVPAAAETTGGTGIRLAIVGRPNVGKSSLLNRIVGYERSIVDATPGTTRDTVDTSFRHGAQDYVLVDTAGIRRRPRVHEQLERASVVRALRALDRAEMALVVIDATDGMADQDARIANYGWDRGRALLLVINKWDAVAREQRNPARFLQALREHYPTLAEVPALFLSARTGAGMNELFPAIERLGAAHRRQVRTVHLNEVLGTITQAHEAPSVRGRAVRFFYATQTSSAPPVVTVFTNAPDAVPASYERYLANELRTAFEWHGTPLRIRFRARHAAQR